MKTTSLNYSFDIGPMVPPSEKGSLLLRVIRNCPWNRCLYCTAYKNNNFERRQVEEIEKDIDMIKVLQHKITSAGYQYNSRRMYDGLLAAEVVREIIESNPEVYGGAIDDSIRQPRLQSICHVTSWLVSGSKTVFLQDSDALIMNTPELIEVLTYLKKKLPSIERITSYARSKTCAKKSVDELKQLHEAGLSRLNVGLESGHEEVLKYMQKGLTPEEHIMGCRPVVESGISLSLYVMPGLGGRKLSNQHALKTADIVNAINPDFIRIRTLAVLRSSPLYNKLDFGEFEPLTEDEMVDEKGLFLENLNCGSYVVSDQATNLLLKIKGRLPSDKEKCSMLSENILRCPRMID